MKDKSEGITRRQFIVSLAAAATITSVVGDGPKQDRPSKTQLNFDIPSKPSVEPFTKEWTPEDIYLHLTVNLGDISFDPQHYAGREGSVISKGGSFFISDTVMSEDERKGIDALCLFDADNERVFTLPKFEAELRKRGYKDPIHTRPVAVATNGTCLYRLCREDNQDNLAVVYVDLSDQKIHVFFQGSSGKKWDLNNFWLSSDGQIGRATTAEEVILYNTQTLETIECGYGKKVAISSDGNVVLYRYDDHEVNEGIKGSTYFIYDENNPKDPKYDTKAFPFCHGGRDPMEFRLSPKGESLLQIKKHPNGYSNLMIFRKRPWGYEESKDLPRELGRGDSLILEDNGTVHWSSGSREFISRRPLIE